MSSSTPSRKTELGPTSDEIALVDHSVLLQTHRHDVRHFESRGCEVDVVVVHGTTASGRHYETHQDKGTKQLLDVAVIVSSLVVVHTQMRSRDRTRTIA